MTEEQKFEMLANLLYDAMPWEGETYQAVAEAQASAMLKAGWVLE